MNTWIGEKIKISIFGESHGACVGCVIDGIDSGIKLDCDFLKDEMSKRRPRSDEFTTQRKETDEFEFVSGVTNGITNGFPICVMFKNKDVKSADYNTNIPRPSHADFPAKIKFGDSCDLNGGGHFSARLTAPLMLLGAICRQELIKRNILSGVAVCGIGEEEAKDFYDTDLTDSLFERLNKPFPLIDESEKEKLEKVLESAKKDGDSLGGVVSCCIKNLPIGLGEPFFDSVESNLAHLLFSIPAVKGVEFGRGFSLAKMRGSAANDGFNAKNIKDFLNGTNKNAEITYTNNAGGILGGMTTSMPIIFKTAFKPIPSIAKVQMSVDMQSYEPAIVKTEGRHDVCAALRGAFVVRAVACICIYDFLMMRGL